MDMNTTIKTVSALSYNLSGLNEFKVNFINTILVSYSISICALQEHWLLDNNLYKLENCFNNYEVFALPAKKANSEFNRGRPSGGIAFLVKNELCSMVKRLTCPGSSRVQGVQLKVEGKSYVYINCYFPVDPQRANMDITEILSCLQDVQYLMDLCDDESVFILTGDLNTDFSRNSVFVNIVKTFLTNTNLSPIWDKFECDYTYSFSKIVNGFDRSYFSTLDHFCVSDNCLNDCVEAIPFHSPDNLSNHVPIILKIKCALVHNLRSEDTNENITRSNKPMWDRATDDNINTYNNHLETLLQNIVIPWEAINCADLHCVHDQHIIDIDEYSACVMDAVSVSVESNIPQTNYNAERRTPIPGWTEFIKPFRDDSIFWHSIWVSAGRPQNNVLHQVMKSTRNRYHYAIRKVRRQESEIRRNNMMHDYLNGKVNNILKDIKTKRKCKSRGATHIDKVSGNENISLHFKNIYEGIYNTHKSTNKINDIFADVNRNITPSDISDLDQIDDILIKNAILKLSSGKSDELYDWGTDALKCGVNVITPYLTCLFKASLVHGHISELFTCCALLPIVKDARKSKFTSDNYRLIAISSVILKLLDYIILELYSDNFILENLQFGFQKKCSTSICTWLLMETINYFTNKGSSVYVCLLDLTKAFDTVKHDILFKKLRDRIPPLFLRLIMYSYIHQTVYVRWSGVKSEAFSVNNGVRQGAVASPTYFNVYIDELFNILRRSGLGCMINNFYYGMLGYADDCSLLAPSRQALQKMLIICQNYFDEHGIKISVDKILKKSKTKCLAFNVESVPANIMLYGKPLPWVESYKHLGHLVHVDENMCHDLLNKKAEFKTKAYSLRQELGNQDPDVFMRLIMVYLSSMYGSNLWDLFSVSADKLYSAWNFVIKGTFNLPFATHRYIVQDLDNNPHIRICLLKRFVKFYSQLRLCSKPEVQNLFDLQKRDVRSTFGRNCYNLCNELQVDQVEDINLSSIKMPIKTPITEEWRIPFLRELLLTRSGFNTVDFTIKEINDVIDYICCS